MWKAIVSGLLSAAILARLTGIYLNWQYNRRYPTDRSFAFVRPPISTDTVIFVHGLHGHLRDTWKLLPELLDQDPDLPRLDVLL